MTYQEVWSVEIDRDLTHNMQNPEQINQALDTFNNNVLISNASDHLFVIQQKLHAGKEIGDICTQARERNLG